MSDRARYATQRRPRHFLPLLPGLAAVLGFGVVPARAQILEPGSLPRDLSPWSMFMSADKLVQGVMIGLVFASVVTWTVWLAKNIELFAALRRLRSAFIVISGERSLDDAYAAVGSRRGILPTLIDAAMLELHLSSDLADKVGIKERIATRLARLEVAASRDMNKGTGVLATIGATAPFVGLFGTVWGIMNSFIGISKAQTQTRCGRSGYCRGPARHRHRPVRGHSRRRHLQSVHTLDRPLPRAGRRCLGRGAAPRVTRSRSRRRQGAAAESGGVSDGGATRQR